MAIVAPVAGAYTGTWNAVALNYTRQGFNIGMVQKAERVEETDLYGETLIELIYRGAAVTVDTICKVYANALRAVFWPWTGTLGAVYTAALPIAQLGSAQTAALVLTSVANTPAASTPATLTVGKAILSPGQNMAIIFNSMLREVPMRWDALLSDAAGTGSLFACT
jgi:hypothetical protein